MVVEKGSSNNNNVEIALGLVSPLRHLNLKVGNKSLINNELWAKVRFLSGARGGLRPFLYFFHIFSSI